MTSTTLGLFFPRSWIFLFPKKPRFVRDSPISMELKTIYLSVYVSISLESAIGARNKTIFDAKITLINKSWDFSENL